MKLKLDLIDKNKQTKEKKEPKEKKEKIIKDAEYYKNRKYSNITKENILELKNMDIDSEKSPIYAVV